MKLKQIKNKADLPAEFSIEKYSSVCDFDICDWVVNLELRMLSMFMEIFYRKNGENDKFGYRCDLILDNPIITGSHLKIKDTPGLSKYIYASSVQDFDATDFYWHGREFVDNARMNKYMEGFHEYFHRYELGVEDFDPELISRIESPYYKMTTECGINDSGDVLLKVDLHGSAEKIKDDFAKWLDRKRVELEIATPKKKFSNGDFSGWANNAILPYLDLTIWARANKCEITQQLLGTTLFPNEFDVNLAERIRKVVAPTARFISREAFTDSLRSQALAEIAEGKTFKTIPEKEALFFSAGQSEKENPPG